MTSRCTYTAVPKCVVIVFKAMARTSSKIPGAMAHSPWGKHAAISLTPMVRRKEK